MGLEEKIMETERIMVLGDHHIPYEDRKTINAVYRAMDDYKPTTVVLLGDLVDFMHVSNWLKDKHDTDDIEKEREKAIRELELTRKHAPKAKIYYVKGNHEERLEKYILQHAEDLYVLPELELKSLFMLDKLGIKYINQRYFKYRGILFSHMQRALKNGTARNLVKDYGMTIVHAHTHRIDYGRWNDLEYIDIGCLCLEQQPYLKKPSSFTQGFATVDIRGREKYITPVSIKNHHFVFRGKYY